MHLKQQINPESAVWHSFWQHFHIWSYYPFLTNRNVFFWHHFKMLRGKSAFWYEGTRRKQEGAAPLLPGFDKPLICFFPILTLSGARLQLNQTSKSWRLSVNWRCTVSASTQPLTGKAPKLIWLLLIWAFRFSRWLIQLCFVEVTISPSKCCYQGYYFLC